MINVLKINCGLLPRANMTTLHFLTNHVNYETLHLKITLKIFYFLTKVLFCLCNSFNKSSNVAKVPQIASVKLVQSSNTNAFTFTF